MKKLQKALLVIVLIALTFAAATPSFALNQKQCSYYTNDVYMEFIKQRHFRNVSENTIVDHIVNTKWAKSETDNISIQLQMLKILKVVSRINWNHSNLDANKPAVQAGAKEVYNMCREDDF